MENDNYFQKYSQILFYNIWLISYTLIIIYNNNILNYLIRICYFIHHIIKNARLTNCDPYSYTLHIIRTKNSSPQVISSHCNYWKAYSFLFTQCSIIRTYIFILFYFNSRHLHMQHHSFRSTDRYCALSGMECWNNMDYRFRIIIIY